ncbi:putative ribonuclease H-like domain-containing protein, partial [Tanacetum coccineum]
MFGEEPATQITPVESPQMVSTVKLPILKKGEYTHWSMRMEQYLTNTYYSLWQVILNGDGPIQVTTDEKVVETEYQLRFHGIKDAKSMWAAIKSRSGGNVESKKMQKNVLKQQFENFSVSDTEGLDKAYDRFQKLISLLEVHGAAVPNEDVNQKFLKALPSSWNNVALIIRNKDEDTSSNNEVNTANGVSTASGHNPQGQASSSLYTDDLMFSFFANQSNSPQLDDEDLEQIDHDDLEEMDLKWKVAMLSMRVKRFYKEIGRRRGHFARECRAPRNQGNKNGDAGYRSRDNTRRTVPVETSDALVVQDNALIVQDGLGYDWSYIAQDEPTEFALMAYTSNSSGSDTELGLESVEAQLVVHQKNEVVYEEKIVVLEFKVKDKSNAVTRLKNQLDETLREKDDLKAKLEQFETSSKNLNKLINSQLSSKDKTGLGYGDQLNENDSCGSELFNSVFDSRSSNGDDNQTNDRFKKDNGYHAVPPPLTGNCMPPLADLSFTGLDDSVYRPTANKTSASVSQVETRKNSGQREIRPVWNSAQKINHQNKFVPSAVLTRFERVPVSAAKQSSLRATTSTSTFRPVNTATHSNRVNVSKLKTNAFHKSHLPIRRSFYKSTAPNTRISNEKVNTVRVNGVNTAGQIAVSTVKETRVTAVKASVGCVWRPKMTDLNNVFKDNSGSWVSKRGNPQQALKNKGIFDSGCSRHMTGNKDFLTDYQDIDGGFVAFGRSARGGKIIGKGKIRTDTLDFEDVFFVKELKFNLFSVSQMCDKRNNVLFTETECLVLSPDFKLLDESQILLRVPRQSNMYNFDLKNVLPSGDLTYLFAKATIDESKLWHRRLGHVNFKTMNKLVKGNLIRGLPLKIFDNGHTCVACQKGKQHKASCKAKFISSISQPLQMLHMDLFGPTSVRSINHKTYCLVVTDDFSRLQFKLLGSAQRYNLVLKSLESVEAQLVVHQKNEAVYEENITVLEFEVKDKSSKEDMDIMLFSSFNWEFMPPLLILSFTGLDDLNDRVESVRPSGVIIEDWVSDDDERMAKKSVLKNMGKNTGQREIRPVWNNVQRINHQNKFVPSAVLTRILNEKVNTVRVKGVNTARQTAVSTVKGNRVTAVKALAGCVWRPKITNLNNVSKDNSGSWVLKRGNLQQALKNKGIFDSVCSRHMTGNKDFLTDYQDIDGVVVAFGGSARGGKITGKRK